MECKTIVHFDISLKEILSCSQHDVIVCRERERESEININ